MRFESTCLGVSGKLTFAVACALLTGCVAHKIERGEPIPESFAADVESAGGADAGHEIVRLNEFPEGNHCFEPLFYVLTLGIIPTHCVLRYHVLQTSERPSSTDDLETHFVVTSMQGWITALLALSPDWQLGYVDDPPAEIEAMLLLE